jgi:AraC-like DNA-binding protein
MLLRPDDRLIIEEAFVSPPCDGGVVVPAPQPTCSFHRRYESFRPRMQFYSRSRSDRCAAYGLFPGMVMLIVDVACSRPFESRLTGQDIVEFHYRLSGSIAIAGTWGELKVQDPTCLIWYQPNGCDDAAEQIGARDNGRETFLSLYCDRTWLCERTGHYATWLLESLESNSDVGANAPRFRLQPQRGVTARIVGDLMRPHGGSALDWLYYTAKATELLCATLREQQEHAVQGPVRRASGADLRLLQQARELLEVQFAEPPQLPVLARRIGMNPTKLCSLFQQRFGESMYEFVRRRRLERARELLACSGLQVRQVAAAVGYRHHSTFTAAFTQHFGVPPKDVIAGAP